MLYSILLSRYVSEHVKWYICYRSIPIIRKTILDLKVPTAPYICSVPITMIAFLKSFTKMLSTVSLIKQLLYGLRPLTLVMCIYYLSERRGRWFIASDRSCLWVQELAYTVGSYYSGSSGFQLYSIAVCLVLRAIGRILSYLNGALSVHTVGVGPRSTGQPNRRNKRGGNPGYLYLIAK